MNRRDFISKAALATAAGAALAGCEDKQTGSKGSTQQAAKKIKWKMVTTWPKNFPGLGTGANRFAELIGKMSGGRLTVKVYGAGELVPAFEVFDYVAKGGAELGHGSAYYWKGKNEAFQFFSTVPFGMNAQEMNAWLDFGGGLDLWKQAYEPFGVMPMAAGNTGAQMAGWFNKEINSIVDLKGLKMRIPGLGGEVLEKAGGTPVNIPGGELFTSLQTGVIDATEWVGPYNDLAFGLHKAAKYYYYPGWHEAGTTLEGLVNKKAFDALPEDLQQIVLSAAKCANQDMLSEYDARNNAALKTLVEEYHVDVRPLPDDVINKLKTLSDEVVNELAKKNEQTRKIHDSYHSFFTQVKDWHNISEKAYYELRG